MMWKVARADSVVATIRRGNWAYNFNHTKSGKDPVIEAAMDNVESIIMPAIAASILNTVTQDVVDEAKEILSNAGNQQ